MMRILIAYYTQTGNTEQIARAIHKGISAAHAVTLVKNDALDTISFVDFDLVFIGSPCHAGTISEPVRRVLTSLPDKPYFQLAGFITHASAAYSTSDYEQCMIYLDSFCKKKGITYHGCFECQGKLAPQLHAFIQKSKKISDVEWNLMVAEMNEHPGADDEKNAMNFARDVIARAET